MDPKQALIDCDQNISDLELDSATEHLADYVNWRNRGGFEPEVYGKRGDTFAADCQRRLYDCVRAPSLKARQS